MGENTPPLPTQLSTSSPVKVSGQPSAIEMTTEGNKKAVTEQIALAWNNQTKLGNLVLSLSEVELGAEKR